MDPHLNTPILRPWAPRPGATRPRTVRLLFILPALALVSFCLVTSFNPFSRASSSVSKALNLLSRGSVRLCFQAPEHGPCNEEIERWFFNASAQQCQPWIWGGCETKGIFKFESGCLDAQCHLYVSPDGLPTECHQEPDPGPCSGERSGAYYDEEANDCYAFVWGGCGGVRPFANVKDCKEQCVLPSPSPSPAPSHSSTPAPSQSSSPAPSSSSSPSSTPAASASPSPSPTASSTSEPSSSPSPSSIPLVLPPPWARGQAVTLTRLSLDNYLFYHMAHLVGGRAGYFDHYDSRYSRFVLEPTEHGNDTYYIISRYDGSKMGAWIDKYVWGSDSRDVDDVVWKIEYAGDEQYTIRSYKTGNYMTLLPGDVYTRERPLRNNQLWSFELVEQEDMIEDGTYHIFREWNYFRYEMYMAVDDLAHTWYHNWAKWNRWELTTVDKEKSLFRIKSLYSKAYLNVKSNNVLQGWGTSMTDDDVFEIAKSVNNLYTIRSASTGKFLCYGPKPFLMTDAPTEDCHLWNLHKAVRTLGIQSTPVMTPEEFSNGDELCVYRHSFENHLNYYLNEDAADASVVWDHFDDRYSWWRIVPTGAGDNTYYFKSSLNNSTMGVYPGGALFGSGRYASDDNVWRIDAAEDGDFTIRSNLTMNYLTWYPGSLFTRKTPSRRQHLWRFEKKTVVGGVTGGNYRIYRRLQYFHQELFMADSDVPSIWYHTWEKYDGWTLEPVDASRGAYRIRSLFTKAVLSAHENGNLMGWNTYATDDNVFIVTPYADEEHEGFTISSGKTGKFMCYDPGALRMTDDPKQACHIWALTKLAEEA